MTLYNSKNKHAFSTKRTFSVHIAILSVFLGLLGIVLIPIFLPSGYMPPCVLIWWVFCLLLALAARFGARESISTVRPWAFVGIFLNLTILIGGALLIREGPRRLRNAHRLVCESNLRNLRSGILYYSDQNGSYPSSDRWCDVLLKQYDYPEYAFVCKSVQRNDKGRCHYAMNPDCEPNSPADTVLLFETKSGWNQYGGLELLTFDNHEGWGANVTFNDGHVEFVKPDEVGKLKWKVENH